MWGPWLCGKGGQRWGPWLLLLLACLHFPSCSCFKRGEGVLQNASDGSIGVVISLSTIPGREDKLRDTIASLLTQTTRVPILVAIPEKFVRFPSARYQVPDWLLLLQCEGVWVLLLQCEGVWVRQCEDIGPITKLACALELPGVSRIITVDDDMAYHPRVVKNLNATCCCSTSACASRSSTRSMGRRSSPSLWQPSWPSFRCLCGNQVLWCFVSHPHRLSLPPHH